MKREFRPLVPKHKPIDVMLKKDLKRIREKFKLPAEIEDETKTVYNKLLKTGILRGRCFELVVPACVYLASKKLGISIKVEALTKFYYGDKKAVKDVENYIKTFEKAIPTTEMRTEDCGKAVRGCLRVWLPSRGGRADQGRAESGRQDT